jgi:cytochrome c2
MRSTWALVLLLLLASADALAADREARARALFTERCASCHTVGQGAPLPAMKHKVDLTLIARQFDAQLLAASKRSEKRAPQVKTAQPPPDPLRDFLQEPSKVKPDTRCGANHLDEVQVELLAGFLKHRAQPPQPPAQIPPAQIQPPQLDEKQHVPTGPGENR